MMSLFFRAIKSCVVAAFLYSLGLANLWAAELWIVVPASISGTSIDKGELKKVFMGRKAAVDGVFLKPINFKTATPERDLFLKTVIELSNDDYVAYWYVRRFSGQGVAPTEIDSLGGLTQRLLVADNIIAYLLLQSNERPILPAGYTLQKLTQ